MEVSTVLEHQLLLSPRVQSLRDPKAGAPLWLLPSCAAIPFPCFFLPLLLVVDPPPPDLAAAAAAATANAANAANANAHANCADDGDLFCFHFLRTLCALSL